MGTRRHIAAIRAVLTLGILFAAPADVSLTSSAHAQPLTPTQSRALETYNRALSDFRSILGERRRQIESNQPLPNLPGQAVYLARIDVMSTYKDLTDGLPSESGGRTSSKSLQPILMPILSR